MLLAIAKYKVLAKKKKTRLQKANNVIWIKTRKMTEFCIQRRSSIRGLEGCACIILLSSEILGEDFARAQNRSPSALKIDNQQPWKSYFTRIYCWEKKMVQHDLRHNRILLNHLIQHLVTNTKVKSVEVKSISAASLAMSSINSSCAFFWTSSTSTVNRLLAGANGVSGKL